MRYIPNSPDERLGMLREIGCEVIEDLFGQVPNELRLNGPIGIGHPVSEPELLEYFRELSERNRADYASFAGGGAYSHFIPVIIDSLVSRSEFLTAYTPYQPEVSQGTLQYIFEFQTMICQLTGMEVANASLYDGSTSLAEAVLMADRVTRRSKYVIAETVHPQYREVVSAYTKSLGVKVDFARANQTGRIDMNLLHLDKETAAVVVQSPNFFGCIEDLPLLADAAHQCGALLIVAITEPMSLGLLKAPGACGADIVVGEGQSFGIPVSFGGPYLGLFATLEKYIRQMPGRLAGEAYDQMGRRGFVLTLSTREQHIRREKATSNICTNQGLYALMATIYLATMGRCGIQEVARQNLQKAHYAAARISELEGFERLYSAPFFNEFVVRTPRRASEIRDLLINQKIVAGIPLDQFYPDMYDSLLITVTETSKRASIDRLAALLSSV
ncbi:MAG TPA: aminomethyl-transferring glycine dehydrogenase subunit GcvPA [Blastocatellia bacterium]|nr:aminomethyl-transferring glycine dehydrogenase subunit GcvPA [Blastocatellia bacterium]